MASKLIIRPSNLWYERERLRDDLHIMGNTEIIKAGSLGNEEDTLYFWVNVPTKSYENIKDYLIYMGKADYGN